MVENKTNILNVYSLLLQKYKYPNWEKLRILLDLWIDIFLIAEKNQLEMPPNCMNLYVAFSKDDYNFPKHVKSVVFKKFKSTLKYILSFIIIPYGVLLGGIRNRRDRYYYFITNEKLKRIKWTINYQFKNEFSNWKI